MSQGVRYPSSTTAPAFGFSSELDSSYAYARAQRNHQLSLLCDIDVRIPDVVIMIAPRVCGEGKRAGCGNGRGCERADGGGDVGDEGEEQVVPDGQPVARRVAVVDVVEEGGGGGFREARGVGVAEDDDTEIVGEDELGDGAG